MVNGIDSCNGTIFRIPVKDWHSIQLGFASLNRTSIFHLMRNLVPLHDQPLAICILTCGLFEALLPFLLLLAEAEYPGGGINCDNKEDIITLMWHIQTGSKESTNYALMRKHAPTGHSTNPHKDSVLPLFKIRYPEINSENSWNFTKYPAILQNVLVFYINCIWCY